MSTNSSKNNGRTIAGLGMSMLMIVGAGQVSAAVIYNQPWDNQHDSFPSFVNYCQDPTAADSFLWDDWRAREDATIFRVRWWGHLTSQAAVEDNTASYCIRIAKPDGQCLPGEIVYTAEVVPQKQMVGQDCLGNPVFAFMAPLPGGFVQTAEEKYFISIAEVNSNSATQNVDFEWSGRRRIRFCPALEEDGLGNFYRPLRSMCDDKALDLSFVLMGM